MRIKTPKEIRDLADGLANALHRIREIHILLDKLDWWILPLNDQNLTDLFDLCTDLECKPREEAKQKLNSYILESYQQDHWSRLQELRARWSDELFFRRNEVFDDALWAHCKGKYTLSVLALTPQIEGIIRDFLDIPLGKWKNAFSKRINSEYNVGQELDKDKLINKDLRKLGLYFSAKRIVWLFKTSSSLKDESFTATLNRHVVTHGKFHEYTALNSLRMFLLIDLLHRVIAEAKK